MPMVCPRWETSRNDLRKTDRHLAEAEEDRLRALLVERVENGLRRVHLRAVVEGDDDLHGLRKSVGLVVFHAKARTARRVDLERARDAEGIRVRASRLGALWSADTPGAPVGGAFGVPPAAAAVAIRTSSVVSVERILFLRLLVHFLAAMPSSGRPEEWNGDKVPAARRQGDLRASLASKRLASTTTRVWVAVPIGSTSSRASMAKVSFRPSTAVSVAVASPSGPAV